MGKKARTPIIEYEDSFAIELPGDRPENGLRDRRVHRRDVPEAGDLYYMRARWYEPRTGRFLSEDPEGLNGGINRYVFGANDPVNNYDPTGRVCWKRRTTDTAPDGTEVKHTKLVCENIGPSSVTGTRCVDFHRTW